MEFIKLIEEICNEENIKYNLISENYVIVLSKNELTKYIFGHKFSLNDHAIGNIIDDKYAFYDLCKCKNIPIVEHKILFNPSSKLGKNTDILLKKYFELYNKDVVIKPNLGNEGINVYHIQDLEILKKEVNKLFENNYSISICPFYSIEKEFRIVILNNKVKLIFEKNKPVVVGDGIKTIKELLIDLNPNYFKNILIDNKYNKVLKKDNLYEYDWRFNLSRGATAKLVTNKSLYNTLSELAIDICKKIEAKFVTVDIIKCNNKLYLLEVNSGVCINKVCNFIDKEKKIAKEIYREAIISMFEK